MTFEEWWKNHPEKVSATHKHGEWLAREAYLAGQSSQKALLEKALELLGELDYILSNNMLSGDKLSTAIRYKNRNTITTLTAALKEKI